MSAERFPPGAIQRYAALSAGQKRRLERQLDPADRRLLRQLLARREAVRRPAGSGERPRLFARHSPRLARLLSELVDAQFKVRAGALAPDAARALQRWIDRESVSPAAAADAAAAAGAGGAGPAGSLLGAWFHHLAGWLGLPGRGSADDRP